VPWTTTVILCVPIAVQFWLKTIARDWPVAAWRLTERTHVPST
jgi:hypothetical protein